MKRRETVKISDMMRLFWEENPEIYHKMLEERVCRLWGELFGPLVAQYTSNVYVKNRVLYVSMMSSVVRGEMFSMRQRLVKRLNDEVGSDVIDDIMIR